MAIQNKFLTRDILATRIPRLDTTCAACNLIQESHQHLFFKCSFSRLLTAKINSWFGPLGLTMNFDNWNHWFSDMKLSIFSNCAKPVALQDLVYMVWININGYIFSHSCLSIDSCFVKIQYVVRYRLCLYRKKFKSSSDRILFEKFFVLA